MREALEITRRTYGQVNPELGSSLSNLAALLKNKVDGVVIYKVPYFINKR